MHFKLLVVFAEDRKTEALMRAARDVSITTSPVEAPSQESPAA